MKELGFFMDDEGDILYYGEWKEPWDPNNRHEVHSTSFIDEIETHPSFLRLNLQYDSNMGLYGKAIAFALQGMVVMQNQTCQGESKFMMHVPKELTESQKRVFADLYSLLSSFEKATIVIPESIYITDKDKINDVDAYYEMQNISKGKSK